MKRVDLFGIVHKGLRAQLFTTALEVARTDFAAPEALGTLQAMEDVLAALREHAMHEDLVTLPMLSAADGALASALAEDHARIEALQRTLAAAMSQPAPGATLIGLFNQLTADHLVHMAREEGEAAPALWTRYSDDELLLARRRIVESIAPDRYVAWMGAVVLPALDPTERRETLAALRAALPPAAYARLTVSTPA